MGNPICSFEAMFQNAPIDAQDLMQRIANDLIDSYDEELELEIEDRNVDDAGDLVPTDRHARQQYFKELFRLQGELVKLQDWVQHSRQKVVILFEGRDAAGKGGVIKRITQRLNPRVARVAALPAPNDRERTQWYFQRYVAHLPAAGEMVLFDRSWYNRAGVERVMGFCSDDEYEEFFRTVPDFEKMLVIFEGRDSAGKGGAIKRVTQRLNPRTCRVVALPAPTNKEQGQWYFQRYVPHLPSAGEMVLFDRSWYNRAGVERVMGFCNQTELDDFFQTVPDFERMLVRSGIILVKYWFSITDEEQEFRFKMRIHDPLKQWKLSPMDLESRVHWEDYTRAKEEMFDRTHTDEAPWWVVQAVDKKRARLNMISHLLSHVEYGDVPKDEIELPPRVRHPDYRRHAVAPERYVPEKY